MGVNGYQGSIRARDQAEGVFKAGTQVMDVIAAAASVQIQYLEKIIIYTRPGTKFVLNNNYEKNVFEMGKTYMYEAWAAEVDSIKFLEDSPPETTIDFIIRKHDPFG